MQPLTPSKGIFLLKKQIKKGEELQNSSPFDEENHSAWEHALEETLNWCFGVDSGMAQDSERSVTSPHMRSEKIIRTSTKKFSKVNSSF
jgi:hypothetical protein